MENPDEAVVNRSSMDQDEEVMNIYPLDECLNEKKNDLIDLCTLDQCLDGKKMIDPECYEIESIPLDQVLEYDQIHFNSNNHFTIRPEDYEEVLSKCETKHWIDSFHIHYSVVNLLPKHVIGLQEMARSGSYRGGITHSMRDEIEQISSNYPEITDTKDKKGYFIRSDHVSLKYGKHKVGPYTQFPHILESAVTCPSSHSPITNGKNKVKFYLLPWKEIHPDREFRVFVYHNRITAISQQHLYQVNQILKDCPPAQRKECITRWIQIIQDFLHHSVIPRIDHVDSYVMDIALLEKEEPYFIEMNPFGKEYSSGSALFHWLRDESILYGETSKIYFRYVE